MNTLTVSFINFKNKTMFKKCKLVMLPSKEKAKPNDIVINITSNSMFIISKSTIDAWNNINSKADHLKPQHLYIISDDEIKNDDWWMYIDLQGTPMFPNQDEEIFKHDKLDKKIIASTDNLNLPQPSQSFITKYIEEYNKGNKIEDVLVEYEEYITDGWVPTYNNPDNHNLEQSAELDIRLKIKDNTITIKKVKESWNKEEISSIIRRFENQLCITFQKDSIPYADIDDRTKFVNNFINNL